MIVKGGTAYIDAGALNLASAAQQTIPGLYAELQTALGSDKPVIINIAGVSPAAAVLASGASGITVSIIGYSILVTSANKATVTPAGKVEAISMTLGSDSTGDLEDGTYDALVAAAAAGTPVWVIDAADDHNVTPEVAKVDVTLDAHGDVNSVTVTLHRGIWTIGSTDTFTASYTADYTAVE